MAMPSGYEKKDEGFKTGEPAKIPDFLKNAREISKPASGYVKIIWIVFWGIITVFQIFSILLIHDPSNFSMFPEGGLKTMIQEIPDQLRQYMPHIVFGVLIPVWYFSVRYRDKTLTKILMGLVSVPVIAITVFYILLAIVIIALFIGAAWIAGKVSGGSNSNSTSRSWDGYIPPDPPSDPSPPPYSDDNMTRMMKEP